MLNRGVPVPVPLRHAHQDASRAWSPEATRPVRSPSSRQKASRLPLLFYCHDAPGAGAIVRATLVQALSCQFRVVVAIDGEALRGFDAPPSIEVIRLPARNGPDVDGDRRRMLMHAYLTVNPAIVLIEQFPFCHPEVAGEIVPLLEAAAANQQTRLIACSAQMPADAPPADPRRDDDAQELADRYFDIVLLHADPRLGRLEESFQPRRPLRVPVRYTGFVGAEPPDDSLHPRRREIVVTAGSGRAGTALFTVALAAFDLLPPAERLRMRIIAGPSLSDDEFASLQAGAAQRAGVAVERSVPDLRGLLAGAAGSVSDCAYDTVVASMRAGVPAVVVPADDADQEQRTRARRIAALGAARVLEPERLSGPSLAEAIAATLGAIPRRLDLDVSGALATVRVVARLSDPDQEFSWTLLGREMV